MPRSEVIVAGRSHKPILWRLLQLYLHDFSEIDGRRVNERGEYEYRYFDAYWGDPQRAALLLRVEGEWAGFALIRLGRPIQMAEFFVLRKFRRHGVGRRFARECFARFPGSWSVHEIRGNDVAQRFWRTAIPVAFTEIRDRTGIAQRFRIQRDS